jgi:predicted transposase YdaD
MSIHDSNFKKLLTTFFTDFVELFFPHISACLVLDSVEFLAQELFLDETEISPPDSESDEDKRIVDLAVKVQVKHNSPLAAVSPELCFIIHLEQQSTRETDFGERMFRYYVRLRDRYKVPVYPIVLFTFDKPFKAQPESYTVKFLDEKIIEFNYRVVQLNRLNWRDFVRQPNLIACALMAKMKIAKADRPRVKLECLRLLATLKLDRGRSRLITSFVDEYLLLEPQETEQFQELIAKLPQKEREQVVLTTTSWKEEGRAEGRQEGLQAGRQEGLQAGRQEVAFAICIRLLESRFPALDAGISERLRTLTVQQLEELAVATLQFSTAQNLTDWLSLHG